MILLPSLRRHVRLTHRCKPVYRLFGRGLGAQSVNPVVQSDPIEPNETLSEPNRFHGTNRVERGRAHPAVSSRLLFGEQSRLKDIRRPLLWFHGCAI
jgi:hypothetical protein